MVLIIVVHNFCTVVSCSTHNDYFPKVEQLVQQKVFDFNMDSVY